MTHNPLNFEQVESLRRHLLLDKGNMAELFGVSRATYHGWTQGKPMRKSNDAKARDVLRSLLRLLKEGWPDRAVLVMEPEERFAALLAALGEKEASHDAEKPPTPEEPVQQELPLDDPPCAPVKQDAGELAAKFGA